LQPEVEAALAELNTTLKGHPHPFTVATGGRKGETVRFDAAEGETVKLPSGETAPAGKLLEWEVPREAPADWPEDSHRALARFWDARIAYAWTDSEIEEFVQSVDACPLEADGDRASCTPSSFREAALIAGYSASGDVIISGKQLPQTSEHQASLSTRFHGQVSADWGWFVRADWNYNSKRYAQVYNLAHTGHREILNLRAGVEGERMSFTAWVDNALDDNASPALIRYVQANDLTFNPFNRAIGATMPEQRRAGVTARFSL